MLLQVGLHFSNSLREIKQGAKQSCIAGDTKWAVLIIPNVVGRKLCLKPRQCFETDILKTFWSF